MECINFTYKIEAGKIVMFWITIRSAAFNLRRKYAWTIPRISAELCVTPTGLLNAWRPVRMTYVRSLTHYFVLETSVITSKHNQY